jgi:hypothetical protein
LVKDAPAAADTGLARASAMIEAAARTETAALRTPLLDLIASPAGNA